MAKYIEEIRNTNKGISRIPSYIFETMVKENQSIFKLLKLNEISIIDYRDLDHYSKELVIDHVDFTDDEKVAMKYSGGNNSDEYNIILDENCDDSIKESMCRLHIYIDNILPYKEVSIVTINFNIICHNKFNMINGGDRTRIMAITEEILNLFTGMQLEGCTGGCMFNYEKSKGNDRMRHDISNNKNFFGNTLRMSVLYKNDENKFYTRQ